MFVRLFQIRTCGKNIMRIRAGRYICHKLNCVLLPSMGLSFTSAGSSRVEERSGTWARRQKKLPRYIIRALPYRRTKPTVKTSRSDVSADWLTISTVSSVTRHSQKKSPRFKSLEFKRKFIGHLGQQIFRIRELTVAMVQYIKSNPAEPDTRSRLA